MTAWPDFISEHTLATYTDNHTSHCDLSEHYGELILQGPDAAKFLQGQVTLDVRDLSQQLSLLGAHCSHKGRVIANFRAIELDQDTLLLSAPRAVLPTLLASLKKYSVFSKVELAIADNQWFRIGCWGKEAENFCLPFTDPVKLTQQNSVAMSKDQLVIRVAEDRYELWFSSSEKAVNAWLQLEQQGSHALSQAAWQQQVVLSGVAEIQAETVEQFLPHALNMQAYGGVSFTKGCYTGQEVIARMEYRGKSKRRLFLAHTSEKIAATAGMDVHNPETGKSIGNIVQFSINNNGTDLLIIIPEATAETGLVAICDNGNTILTLATLPYAIP